MPKSTQVKHPTLSSPTPETYDVLAETIGYGDVRAMAHFLRISPSMVSGWIRPPECDEDYTATGRINPLDRIASWIAYVHRKHGIERARPVARFVAKVCGGLFVPALCGDLIFEETLLKVSGDTLRRTGEMLDTLADASRDGIITDEELLHVETRIDEAIAALEQVRQFVRAEADSEKR